MRFNDKNNFYTRAVFIVLFVFAFIFSVQSFVQAAVVPNGNMLYGDTTNAGTVKTIRFTNPGTFGSEASGVSSSASNITHLVAKTAPTRDEIMIGHLKVDGRLDIITCTPSTGCDATGEFTARWNNPGTTGTQDCDSAPTIGTCTQAFDLGYESLSGRAMVVYADTTAATLYYALWDGSSWSPNASPGSPGVSNDIATNSGGPTCSGTPRWVRVVSAGDNLADDRNNRVMMMMADSNNDLCAFYWDGETWDAGTTLYSNLSNCDRARCFDGNWQGQNSFIVSYTNASANEIRYQKFTAGSGWVVGDTQAYTLASLGEWVMSAADPTSSRIYVTTTSAGNDTRGAVWRSNDASDGWTVCASGGCPDTLIETVTGNQANGVFERFNGHALHVFNNSGTTNTQTYMTYDGSSTWGSATTLGSTSTDDLQSIRAIPAPNSDDIFIMATDVDCDMDARMWDGSTLQTISSNFELLASHTNNSCANAAPVEGMGNGYSYDFAWSIYSPWSRNWRWYDGDDTANTPTTALATENATSTVDGYNEKLRLRFNMAELAAGANGTDLRKKLQYSTSTDHDNSATYWADVDNAAGLGEWRYVDCNGGSSVCDDGTVMSGTVLTGSAVAGWWNLSKNAAAGTSMDHAASAITELEFPIEANAAATGTTYYFRMYDADLLTHVYRQQTYGATPCAGSTVCTYPVLKTATSTYNLEAYRFFANTNTTDVGSALNTQNSTTTLTSTGQQFRLRTLVHVGTAGLGVNKGDFKLQYALKGSGTWCGAPQGSWADVNGSTPISFYNNASPADGASVTGNASDPDVGHTVVDQTYEESNNFTNPSAIPSGQDGMWDFSLYDNGGTAGATYCLRVVSQEPGSSTTYATYPAVVMRTPVTTTLGDGTDPSNSTIGPGAVATEIDRFSFVTDSGTDTVTDLTVTLGPASAYTNIATVDVQTTGGSSQCSATPSSNTVSLTSCAISVTTSLTEYKIMITPKSHANMSAPATGASYATVATVTAFVGDNEAGTDTDSATITVDNASPSNVSSASVSAGDTLNSLSWTNPGDADLSTVMVLASTSGAVTFTPVEGTTYSTSTLPDGTRVACYGLQTSCNDMGLSNGTAYYYKIYVLDSRGNWSDTGVTPSGSPATPFALSPAISQAHYRWRYDDGSESEASYAAAEDTPLTAGVWKGDRRRLRFTLSNTGTGSATDYTYRLEYSSTSCSLWTTVPAYQNNSYEEWVIDPSSKVIENQATTDSSGLTNPGGKTFTAGYIQNTSNQSTAHTLTSSQFTELEYSLRSTAYAVPNTTYCFRLTNAGATTYFTHTVQPQISIYSIPNLFTGGDYGGNEGSGSNNSRSGGGSGGGNGNAGGEGAGSGPSQGGGNEGGGGGGDTGFLYRGNMAQITLPKLFTIFTLQRSKV